MSLTKKILPLQPPSCSRFIPPGRQLLRRPCLQPLQAKGEQVEVPLSGSLPQGTRPC